MRRGGLIQNSGCRGFGHRQGSRFGKGDLKATGSQSHRFVVSHSIPRCFQLLFRFLICAWPSRKGTEHASLPDSSNCLIFIEHDETSLAYFLFTETSNRVDQHTDVM